MKFYISFGQAHVHRINGETLDYDCLAEIEAKDYQAARKQANELFDDKWSALYEESAFNLSFFPRGIIPIN